MPRVEFHPTFAAQFAQLAEDAELLEVAGEVNGLLMALEQFGRLIERSDISHPIESASYDIHTLRRTPPNEICPYADHPPVIRIFYAWFIDVSDRAELAVVFEMGDKSRSSSPNDWYRPVIGRIESVAVPQWERAHPTHRAVRRRTR